MAITHQLSKHLGARHYRNALLERQRHLGVGSIDRAGHYQHIGTGNVTGLMADENLRTEALQTLGTGRHLEVRAGHLVTQVEQHLGDSAHADPADTDEMDATDTAHAPDLGFHRSR